MTGYKLHLTDSQGVLLDTYTITVADTGDEESTNLNNRLSAQLLIEDIKHEIEKAERRKE